MASFLSRFPALRPATPFSPAPARGWAIWGLAAPVLAIAFVIAAFLPATRLLDHFQLLDRAENPVGIAGFAGFLLLPFTLIIDVVLAWTRFVERRPLATIGLAAGSSTAFLRGHAIGVAMIVALAAGIWLSGAARAQGYALAFGSPAALLDIAILLAGFAVQSSAEELLFRGWLLSAIARKLGLPLALLLTSAVFTLLHYDSGQPWLVPANLFLFSLFACFWALRAGSVWGVMGWHAGWNWLLAVGFELPVTGLDAHEPALLVKLMASGPAWLTGGGQGPEGSVFCALLFAGGIAWLLRDFRKGLSGCGISSHLELRIFR